MTPLRRAEVDAVNRVLAHAEQIVNARGQRGAAHGHFEDADWKIRFGRVEDLNGAETCLVEILRHGRVVLRVGWDDTSVVGRARVEPVRSWVPAFLQVPTAPPLH